MSSTNELRTSDRRDFQSVPLSIGIISALLLWQHLGSNHIVQAQANTITISEIMASNNNTVADEDGVHSDWIEIHNSGNSMVNLQGAMILTR